jgi:hypothetical protein
LLWALGAALALLSGCATSDDPTGRVELTSSPSASVALVTTEAGLAGVLSGSSEPAWVAAHAVAAPDGSAIFDVRATGEADELVRIDPRTGASTGIGRLPHLAGRRVSAVEPRGHRVALSAPGPGDSTVVVTFDTEVGRPLYQQTFEGRVEPEAFSPADERLYAARTYGSYYRVQVLDLTTGDQYPTTGPDKTQDPEDMYGAVVQAALSPDGTQLATLYRDTTKPDHTAFVHLLQLASGLTVCIDLHEPFGTTGRPLVDAIGWADGDTITVGHTGPPSVVAAVSATTIWTTQPQPHYHAEVRTDVAPPVLPTGLDSVPGIHRFIATIPS